MPRLINIAGHDLMLEENEASGAIGSRIWDCSLVLARFLERNSLWFSNNFWKNKHVLELGAGVGINMKHNRNIYFFNLMLIYQAYAA
jgi:hypothetical protein